MDSLPFIEILSPTKRFGRFYVLKQISAEIIKEHCKEKRQTNNYYELSDDELDILYEKSKEKELEFMKKTLHDMKSNLFRNDILPKPPSKNDLKKYLEPLDINDYKK